MTPTPLRPLLTTAPHTALHARPATAAGPGHHRPRAGLRWWLPVNGLALGLALLAGCGGGGSDDSALSSTPTTGTSAVSYTEGTVNGFGSVIVNGVRFDDSGASVSDDSGAVRSISALKLGMRVAVDSSAVDTAASTAKASHFRYGSALVGPVSAINTTAGTLVLLGQTVDVTDTTVFDDSLSGGLSALATGVVLEVHGVLNAATGHLVASRIESEASATVYKLRGVVSALNTTALTFQIGDAVVSYAGVSAVPSTLADGVTLRVLLATTPVSGVWQATSLGAGSSRTLADSTSVQLRGTITALSSSTSFTVGTQLVDASAASFPDGSAGVLLGAAVEVKGAVLNGVLVATKVELENQHRSDSSRQMHLHGSITSVDAAAGTFVVRGVTVSHGSSTVYTNGSAASLLVGTQVHVTGGVGSTHTLVVASAIRIGS